MSNVVLSFETSASKRSHTVYTPPLFVIYPYVHVSTAVLGTFWFFSGFVLVHDMNCYNTAKPQLAWCHATTNVKNHKNRFKP